MSWNTYHFYFLSRSTWKYGSLYVSLGGKKVTHLANGTLAANNDLKIQYRNIHTIKSGSTRGAAYQCDNFRVLFFLISKEADGDQETLPVGSLVFMDTTLPILLLKEFRRNHGDITCNMILFCFIIYLSCVKMP